MRQANQVRELCVYWHTNLKFEQWFCPSTVILSEAKDLALLVRTRTLHATLGMPKQSYIYILTNKSKTVLYIGDTSNLQKGIDSLYYYESSSPEGFLWSCCYRYGIDGIWKNKEPTKLVYWEPKKTNSFAYQKKFIASWCKMQFSRSKNRKNLWFSIFFTDRPYQKCEPRRK